MAETPHRETMSSLLATHTAIRVARDVGFPTIDVKRMYCENCRAELDWEHASVGQLLICPSCGTRNALPLHLRQFVQRCVTFRPTPKEAEPQRVEFVNPTPTLLMVFFFIWFFAVIAVFALWSPSLF